MLKFYSKNKSSRILYPCISYEDIRLLNVHSEEEWLTLGKGRWYRKGMAGYLANPEAEDIFSNWFNSAKKAYQDRCKNNDNFFQND